MEKTTELSQATDKLCHIMLYTLSGVLFKLTTLVVIGTDCIVSCKSKDHDSPFFATNKMKSSLILIDNPHRCYPMSDHAPIAL